MNQHDYWNFVAETKRFTTTFPLASFSRLVSSDATILDVGCGYGRTLAELDAAGFRNLSGVDFSEKLVERGRREFPTLNLSVGTGAKIERADASVDAVLLLGVLTCVVDDAEQEAFIAEIRRVLKPGGVLCVDDFLLNDDARNLERYEKYAEKYGVYGAFELPEGAVLRHHSQERIFALLAPFETLEFQPKTFATMNGHTSRGFSYLGRK